MPLVFPKLSPLVKSTPDPRNYPYIAKAQIFPPLISLRAWAGDIKNQLSEGSCVANAWANIFELIYFKATGKQIKVSRQFIYDMMRIYEGRWGQQGAMLDDGPYILWRDGVPLESEYPYRDSEKQPIDPTTMPDIMASAATRKLLRYEFIGLSQGLDVSASAFKSALMEGLPIAIAQNVGAQLYNVMGPLDQQVYDPVGPGNILIGAHATAIEEWSAALDFVDENSWGDQFGFQGFWRIKQSVLVDIYDAIVARGIIVDGVKCYVEPNVYTDQQIRDFVNATVAQYAGDPVTGYKVIWDAKVQHGIESAYLEYVMTWPAGSVDQYARDHGWL